MTGTTTPAGSARASRHWRHWLALGVSAATLFVAMWGVIPAPTYALLPLSVGAPEVSAWLALSAAAAFLASAGDARTNRVARAAAVVAALALVFPALVLARIPGTIRRFDAAMESALGPGYRDAEPPAGRAALQPQPIRIGGMFLGTRLEPARVTRDVAFASPDGVRLALDIYQPVADGSFPAIVQIHGGGWQTGARSDNAAFAHALAAQGYIVFAIDYRHAPAWRWPAQRDDVRAALAWIRAEGPAYGADVSRIALVGRSAGSQLALITAVTDAGPSIRGVVLFYSPVNLTEGYRHPGWPDTLNLRQLEIDFIGGTPDDRPEAYRDASPITYASRPHPPVLLVNGGQDRIVFPAYAEALHERLRASGTSILLIMPWADHSFDAAPVGPSSQMARYYAERFLAWVTR